VYCRHCRYDLRRLDFERCPECGRAFAPDDPRTWRRHRKDDVIGAVAEFLVDGGATAILFMLMLLFCLLAVLSS
jgi:hypothetical protein